MTGNWINKKNLISIRVKRSSELHQEWNDFFTQSKGKGRKEWNNLFTQFLHVFANKYCEYHVQINPPEQKKRENLRKEKKKTVSERARERREEIQKRLIEKYKPEEYQ